MFKNSFENKAINAMRYVGLKSIQAAKGGHIGMTISAAPITFTLFTKFININPNDGKWINRDRFVLSAGHGSLSYYSILYLSGIISKEEMINFKQENSLTPGHPEFENNKSNFIDASTGPLGQGLAMAVGMALAQQQSNIATKNEFDNLFTNWTYVVCGDGDLQEGISYEAMAIAGKYNLNKLIVLHDSNKFQLDSAVSKVSIENLELRVKSNNWFYIKCSNEPSDIENAIKQARLSNKPSFIEVDTIIAEGLTVGNSDKGHHGLVTDEELDKFQLEFGTNFSDWEIDKDVLDYFHSTVIQRNLKNVRKWNDIVNQYKSNPNFNKLMKIIEGDFDYKSLFKNVFIDKKDQATRVYLKSFLNSLIDVNPFALATCADLASSTNLIIGKNTAILYYGQSLPIGIREFAMGAIMNGFVLYGSWFKIIGGTFLVFADYIKPAIRLGALMKLPTIYAFTHDSYLVGGDGPTHQPYDQLPMLRAIDNVNVYRPADEEEFRYCITESYLSKNKTSILVLSRQNVKSLNINIKKDELKNGAYIVKNCENPDYVLAASGSEVQLALEVSNELSNARVISVPCLNKAIKMNQQELVNMFGAKKALITIETSSDYMWLKLHLSNQRNIHIGAYTFGKSMDGNKLYKDKGFNKEFILSQIK